MNRQHKLLDDGIEIVGQPLNISKVENSFSLTLITIIDGSWQRKQQSLPVFQ